MADLEFERTITPGSERLEVTCSEDVVAGQPVKMEIGEHELNEYCPVGKAWQVVGNIRVIETDA